MSLDCYSRLNVLLAEQDMKVPDLYRKLAERGAPVDIKSLYRLNDPLSPVEKIDARIAAHLCDVLGVDLGVLFSFREKLDLKAITPFPASRQKRLEALLDANRENRIDEAERKELSQLVEEAETLMLSNARVLARQRQSLAQRHGTRRPKRKAS